MFDKDKEYKKLCQFWGATLYIWMYICNVAGLWLNSAMQQKVELGT